MTSAHRFDRSPRDSTPELRAGERLKQPEFHRRYEAMPDLRGAELIEGVVHMPSPMRSDQHGEPLLTIATWLGTYVERTPGVRGAGSATVILDEDNEIEPDLSLRIDGGACRIDDGYIVGAPELVVEVSASTVRRDLGKKLEAYRRNGVREYVVWRVQDRAIDWLVLRDAQFVRLARAADGLLRSDVFPGLWLDEAALVHDDRRQLRAVVELGCESAEHARFVAGLRSD